MLGDDRSGEALHDGDVSRATGCRLHRVTPGAMRVSASMLGVSLGRFVKGLAGLEEEGAPTEDADQPETRPAESGHLRE